MRVRLAYGKTGLDVEFADDLNVTVVEPKYVPALPDPGGALRQALRAPIISPPLRDRVKASDRVGVVFCDITRPAPSHLMVPAVLDELTHVPRQNITLFNARY